MYFSTGLPFADCLLLFVFYSCTHSHEEFCTYAHMDLINERFKSIYSDTKYSVKKILGQSPYLPLLTLDYLYCSKLPMSIKEVLIEVSFYCLEMINFVQAEIKTIHTGAISNCTSCTLSTICCLYLFIQLFLENIQVFKKSGESNGNWYWSKLFRIQGSNLFHQ